MKTDGTLSTRPSGRWGIAAPGREPVEIAAGEQFRVEVPGYGELRRTRMGQCAGGKYYAVEGYGLRDGLRAGFLDQRERYAKELGQ
jgi:hypothetical protein